jgi:hypothetical protein
MLRDRVVQVPCYETALCSARQYVSILLSIQLCASAGADYVRM